MENEQSQRAIFQELLEIENNYRALQTRAQYLITQLRTEFKDVSFEELPARRNSRHLPLGIYVNEIRHLLKRQKIANAREIRSILENRYRTEITNIYQMMDRVIAMEPRIEKIGRGLYGYKVTGSEKLSSKGKQNEKEDQSE